MGRQATGGQLMQVAFYYTNIVRPLAAPQTTLRVVWSLLFPVKRGAGTPAT
jgi:hypothetical protein